MIGTLSPSQSLGFQQWASGTIREEWRLESAAGTVFVRVSDTGKMITEVYAEEVSFFPQRVILRAASIAAMFYTSKKLDDSPSGRFWTLIQDGNVYPEMPSVPSATGFGWFDGRNKPILDE